MVQDTKMDYGQPNTEIVQKMANGWLLFLALPIVHAGLYTLKSKLVDSFLQVRSHTEAQGYSYLVPS